MERDKLQEYVESTLWAPSTKHTALSKLRSLYRIGDNPSQVYGELTKKGYSRYSIKTAFILAAGYEGENSKFKQFLQEHKHVFTNAYKEKTSRVTTEIFSSMLRDAESYPELFNAIYLMGKAGLRVSEALNAKWDDFIEADELRVVGKGDKQRIVFVSRKSLSLTSSKAICGDLKLSSIRGFFVRYKPYTPHSLRAFFITQALEKQGLNLKQVQNVVGHSSLSTTQRYWRADIDDAKRRLLK